MASPKAAGVRRWLVAHRRWWAGGVDLQRDPHSWEGNQSLPVQGRAWCLLAGRGSEGAGKELVSLWVGVIR